MLGVARGIDAQQMFQSAPDREVGRCLGGQVTDGTAIWVSIRARP